MKGLTAAIALFLLSATMSPGLMPVPGASTDLPVWNVGDYWVYSTYGLALPFPSRATVKYEVVGTELIAWQGASFETYNTMIFANASGTTPAHVGDAWFLISNLALFRLTLLFSFCFVGFPPSCGNTSATQTMSQPLPLRFPLTSGDNWSASTTLTDESLNLDNGTARWANSTVTGNFGVASDTFIAVPAGNFSATPVWENLSSSGASLFLSYGPRALVDYSSSVGYAVEEVVYANPRGPCASVAVLALSAYSHALPWYSLTFVGIPVWAWLLVVAALSTGVLIVLLRRRRQRPRGVPETGEE